MAVTIESAVKDFKKGGFKYIASGLLKLGEILANLPSNLSQCSKIAVDVNKLEQWATMFDHPEDVLIKMSMNLLMNQSKIYSKISSCIKDFDNDRYFDFGTKIGDALILATGVPATRKMIE